MTDPSPADITAVAETYFAAWEARDPDAIVALHSGDTKFWTHAGSEPVHGRAAVREAFAQVFEQFPEYGFETHRVVYGPGHWVLDWTLTWQPAGGGERAGFDCIDLVIVEDGLVARKDTFIDMVQLQAAMPELDVAAAASGATA